MDNVMFGTWGKKGQTSLTSDARDVGALAILIAIVLALVVGVRNTFTSGTAEYNSTNSFVSALGTYGSYGVVIVLIGIGVYLLARLKNF